LLDILVVQVMLDRAEMTGPQIRYCFVPSVMAVTAIVASDQENLCGVDWDMARPANAAAPLAFYILWGDKRTSAQRPCLGFPSAIVISQNHTRFSKSMAWNGTSWAACPDRKKLANDLMNSKLHRFAQFLRRCANAYSEPWRIQSSTAL
jgi:hypothetical protein